MVAEYGVGEPQSAELRRRESEQLARHHEQLNLLGALEDVEDLRVAGPLLKQFGLAIARGAAELDRPERDVYAGASGLRLCHRCLERIGLAVVRHPGSFERQEPRRLIVGLELEQARGGR